MQARFLVRETALSSELLVVTVRGYYRYMNIPRSSRAAGCLKLILASRVSSQEPEDRSQQWQATSYIVHPNPFVEQTHDFRIRSGSRSSSQSRKSPVCA
jgi:hypothetical protein